MTTMKLKLAGACVAALAFAWGPAVAQDCPRGTLDERYCDVDGDLIADIPTDASEWLDPDTLIFAYTPVEDPAVYKEAWADFLTYLEEKTGKNRSSSSRSSRTPRRSRRCALAVCISRASTPGRTRWR